jgi:WD40-like Beta Propeller Repeat
MERVMTDLEEKIRDALQDPRWDLAAWPDPMPRLRRAARQRTRLAAMTAVLLAAVVTPLALLPGLVVHRTGVQPLPAGTEAGIQAYQKPARWAIYVPPGWHVVRFSDAKGNVRSTGIQISNVRLPRPALLPGLPIQVNAEVLPPGGVGLIIATDTDQRPPKGKVAVPPLPLPWPDGSRGWALASSLGRSPVFEMLWFRVGHTTYLATAKIGWKASGPAQRALGQIVRSINLKSARHAPPARPDTPPVPSWAKRLGGEVAYKCADLICLMRPDGTGKRNLSGTFPEWDPSWSPDGRRLAFRGYYGAGDGAYDLYIIDANGCHVTRLTHRMNGTRSSWSPAGRQIVFSVPLGMYVINADGSGLRQLLGGERYAYGVDAPAWSRGNRIAYARYLPSQHRTEIYAVNADGSGNTALTRGAPGFGQPAWSPDGKSIAFVANPSSTSSIEVAAADGRGVQRVSPRSWTSYSPTWTPGGKIVFLREIGGATQSSAYIVNRDGSGLRLLYPELDALQIAWGAATLPRVTC